MGDNALVMQRKKTIAVPLLPGLHIQQSELEYVTGIIAKPFIGLFRGNDFEKSLGGMVDQGHVNSRFTGNRKEPWISLTEEGMGFYRSQYGGKTQHFCNKALDNMCVLYGEKIMEMNNS